MPSSLDRDLNLLGLDAQNYRALMLMPAIYVAWADREITDAERARVYEIAQHRLALTDHELAPVRRWLDRAPTKGEFQHAFQVLMDLAETPAEPLLDLSQVPELLTFAERVGSNAGGVLGGQSFTILPAERAALADLESALGVSVGLPWADIVGEVDGVEARRDPQPNPWHVHLGSPLQAT